MSRRARNTNETSNHPFRSLFDLMLSLVFLLLVVILLQHPKSSAAPVSDVTERRSEMLYLHNLQRKDALGENTKPWDTLDELKKAQINPGEPPDPCLRLLTADAAPLTDEERKSLEQHRLALWRELQPYMNKQLHAQHQTSRIGQDKLLFPRAIAVPSSVSHLSSILDEVRQRVSGDPGKENEGFSRVRIEGHTDSIHIATAQFPSNWELSAARAIWLAKQIEEDWKRRPLTARNKPTIVAIGYGDHFPIASNDTEKHRSLNRRIEIVYEK